MLGNVAEYINQAVHMHAKLSGNGIFTEKCQQALNNRLRTEKCLLTTSCTDALEMAALLSEIKEGDEIIMPSFTFVSTALAFVRQGATIVFADSRPDHPGIDEETIEPLITIKTKAIIPVHYAGVSCNMDKIRQLATKYNLLVIEDAAQAIDSFYKGSDNMFRPLGSIGHLGCFSFHETKNVQCGEGGLLTINDPKFAHRSEIIWEKGTNRAEFFRGEVNKYGWVDIGSSFLPSEITAAFLYAQLEHIDLIQSKRKELWETYYRLLKPLEHKGLIKLPIIPDYATNNAHMFYILCNSLKERSSLISFLKKSEIMAVFHYQSLHNSQYYQHKHDGRILEYSDLYSDQLLRLPLYYDLSLEEVSLICERLMFFYNG
jgi:dTDP-4-amino-4,6-dideoxygalactose transaminase